MNLQLAKMRRGVTGLDCCCERKAGFVAEWIEVLASECFSGHIPALLSTRSILRFEMT